MLNMCLLPNQQASLLSLKHTRLKLLLLNYLRKFRKMLRYIRNDDIAVKITVNTTVRLSKATKASR